jgi:NAD(P)-dependent dehydrogenase (short-subunit alcohol dehydrogenase family)/acyl carrier protein
MAAIQVAQWIGAEVLATASPSKWETVRALGVSRIASSRDLSFAQTFAEEGGADMVLNSLAGEAVDAGLSLLRSGGRFVEMGKTDIRSTATVQSTHPGVGYQAFDLPDAGLDRIAEMLSSLSEGFSSGRLRGLPVRNFAVTEAESAFRFMAQARHVGKLALRSAPVAVRTDGTVLVTGGLSGLGLEVARTMAQKGTTRLLLLGRRGMGTPGAGQAVAELRALGCDVSVAAVDVADIEALGSVLATIPSERPLRGVIHCAAVLDDGLLGEQTSERFDRVMGAKVLGAWNLHTLTAGMDLDQFVLFSSMAGTFGSAGQSGYAAANAFLDGLAAHRQSQGLRAISLAWGPWSESGMASHLDASQKSRFSRDGVGMLSLSQGLGLFEEAVERSETQLVLAPLDLRQMTRSLSGSVPAVWRGLVRARSGRSSSSTGDWAQQLSSLPAEQRAQSVLDVVRGEVARVLSLHGAGAVAVDRPLKELGLDSLMAVELRNALGRRAGAKLPATLAFDHPTTSAVAQFLLEQVLAVAMPAPAAPMVASGSVVSDEPIAIVSVGCRLPGGVTDAESFWDLLDRGVDAITEVPADRWDADVWYDAGAGFFRVWRASSRASSACLRARRGAWTLGSDCSWRRAGKRWSARV